MKKYNKKNKDIEKTEPATKYGEFISSYFNWITLDEQKEIVENLENITKDK